MTKAVPTTIAVQDVSFHEAADIFPLLNGERFEELVEDIRIHGQRAPIAMLKGQVLDGRNRYLACRQLGIEPIYNDLPDDIDPYGYVWSLNGERRDLNPDQRFIIWTELEE